MKRPFFKVDVCSAAFERLWRDRHHFFFRHFSRPLSSLVLALLGRRGRRGHPKAPEDAVGVRRGRAKAVSASFSHVFSAFPRIMQLCLARVMGRCLRCCLFFSQRAFSSHFGLSWGSPSSTDWDHCLPAGIDGASGCWNCDE